MSKSRPLSELDELMTTEELNEASRKARSMLFSISLSELRSQLHMTQSEVADIMGVKQPTVSSLEKSGDAAKIETLQRYISAIGGTMHIGVEMPDGKHFDVAL
ncbi:helix-turn-helix transcriptional regulator [Vibrio fluvialis]|nr:helix-turn-helix transcriptional regulator [Vibrio fluvialis]